MTLLPKALHLVRSVGRLGLTARGEVRREGGESAGPPPRLRAFEGNQ